MIRHRVMLLVIALAISLPASLASAQEDQLSPTRFGYGYYDADNPRYGDFYPTVRCYTDLYYAWVKRGYQRDAAESYDVWGPRFRAALARAHADHKRIYLNLQLIDPELMVLNSNGTVRLTSLLTTILRDARDVWPSVEWVELGDEPDWCRGTVDRIVAAVRQLFVDLQLQPRPLGITLDYNRLMCSNCGDLGANEHPIETPGLDYVGIEAYLRKPGTTSPGCTPIGSSDPQQNVSTLNQTIRDQLAVVSPSKKVMVVMQAYTKNASWNNYLPSLLAMQRATYEAVRNNPRITALTMFSLRTVDGCAAFPELTLPHREIGAIHLGSSVPPDCQSVGLTVSDATVIEGTGASATASFDLRLARASAVPVSVAFSTTAATASAGADYIPQAGTVSFAPGQTQQSIAVQIISDSTHEATEEFLLDLSNPVGVLPDRLRATATILDDDPLPSLSVSHSRVVEGDSGQTAGRVHFTLSNPSAFPISFTASTSDATAHAGEDYAAASARLTIPPGATILSPSVTVFGDSAFELDETLLISATDVTGAVPPPSSGSLTIENDDAAPIVTIAGEQRREGNRGSSRAYFSVQIAGETRVEAEALLTVTDGTAKGGLDYVSGPPTKLTFPVGGSIVRSVGIEVLGDVDPEGHEILFGTLSQLVAASAPRPQAQIQILNDDAWTSAPALPRSDFNGDGQDDLLFEDAATGALTISALRGNVVLSNNAILPSKPAVGAWKVAGSADFDGDGHPDLLFRNMDSGNLAIWYLDGLTRTRGGSIPGPLVSNVELIGTGDFNGDGRPDLLWRDLANSQCVVWYLDDATVIGSAHFRLDQTFEVAAIGDLDGDGDPDILLRHLTSGALGIQLMNGVQMGSYVDLQSAGQPPANWRAVSLIDVDVDGHLDVVWQNATSNRLVVWFLSGTNKVTGAYFVPDESESSRLLVGPR